MVSATRRQARPEGGYNLVALMVIVGVLVLLLGVAVPGFELGLKREREKEAIFRGLQIAEAIRVFQLRQGRLPVTLEELLEVEPRSIRQLWRDPLTEDGVWGLVRGAAAIPGGDANEEGAPGDEVDLGEGDDGGGGDDEDEVGADGRDDLGEESEGSGGGPFSTFELGRQDPTALAVGPIAGVFSRAKGVATILFQGEEVYKEWRFTPELLPKPVVSADGELVTRANAETVGRTFLYGLAPGGLSALEPDELAPSGGATDVFGEDEDEEEGRGGDDGEEEDDEGDEEDE